MHARAQLLTDSVSHKLYLTLCNPLDCSLPGSSVRGILQARILKWVAISFSRDLPNPGIESRSSALQADSLPTEPPGKTTNYLRNGNQNWGFPGGTSGKEHTCKSRKLKRSGFNPWVRKIPWRREWQPTPVFLSGKSHGQRILVGYNPWSLKRVGHDKI